MSWPTVKTPIASVHAFLGLGYELTRDSICQAHDDGILTLDECYDLAQNRAWLEWSLWVEEEEMVNALEQEDMQYRGVVLT